MNGNNEGKKCSRNDKGEQDEERVHDGERCIRYHSCPVDRRSFFFFFFQVEKIKEAREENHLRCGVIQEEQQTTTTMRRTPLLAPCQKF